MAFIIDDKSSSVRFLSYIAYDGLYAYAKIVKKTDIFLVMHEGKLYKMPITPQLESAFYDEDSSEFIKNIKDGRYIK